MIEGDLLFCSLSSSSPVQSSQWYPWYQMPWTETVCQKEVSYTNQSPRSSHGLDRGHLAVTAAHSEAWCPCGLQCKITGNYSKHIYLVIFHIYIFHSYFINYIFFTFIYCHIFSQSVFNLSLVFSCMVICKQNKMLKNTLL